MTEGFLTLAYGSGKYVRMAKALASSYRRHKPSRPFAVVTDQANKAALSRYFDDVIVYDPAFGSGVVQKLHLDKYAKSERTLFVDSDCLFYKHPDLVWQSYATGPFVVRGWRHLTGSTDYEKATPYEWLTDVGSTLAALNIEKIGHFNSGLVFFDKSPTAKSVFDTSRAIYGRRAELGFVSFKGAPVADEPALAAGMEIVGVPMEPWDPENGMETAIGMHASERVNVLTGNSRFLKNGDLRSPALIHFNIDAQNSETYERDMIRLSWGRTPLLSGLAGPATKAKFLSRKVSRLGHRLRRKLSKR